MEYMSRRLPEKEKNLNFKPSNADPCIYIYNEDKRFCILTVYVDDIVLFCQNLTDMNGNVEDEI